LKTGIRLGGEGRMHEFDFAAWLDGTGITETKLNGKIDTDLSFTSADWQLKSRI
jgi:hypothetical protein